MTNYILIDYENVQPAALLQLTREHVRVIVFMGATQTKVTFEVAAALQAMGPRATYVKVCGTGANALDFHIAFYIGQLAAQEPGACFHSISKDTGFDPLIQHLQARKIAVRRLGEVEAAVLSSDSSSKPATISKENEVASVGLVKAIPKPPATQTRKALSKPAKATLAVQIDRVTANLKKRGSGKPKSVEALKNSVRTLFKPGINDKNIEAIVQELQKQKHIVVDGTQVSYPS